MADPTFNTLIAPNSGLISFSNDAPGSSNLPSLSSSARIVYTAGGGLTITSKVSSMEKFAVEGRLGTLFTVTDAVSGALFQLRDVTGFPIVEFLDNGDLVTTGSITALEGNSQEWSSVYSNVQTNSANWNSVYTTVNTNSGNYILDGGNTKGSSLLIGTNDAFNLNLETNNNVRLSILSSGEVIINPVSAIPSLNSVQNALNVRGTAAVYSDISSLSGLSALSGTSPGQFSAGGMLIGQNDGGAYLGRVGVRENSWQVLSGTEGVNWTARQSNRTWWGIAMSSDGRIQTAVVDGGQIYTSYDYGVTWTARESNRNWRDIAMSSDGRIQTAVVFNGQIYTSYDYGVTWTARDSNRLWYKIAMSSDGRIQTAVVAGGQIYTSYDYGVTWTARESNRVWPGIAMSSDGRIQTAVVAGDQIYTSYDYGVTWTARESGRDWREIAMSSDGRIQTAVAHNGQIYTSYDYGVTWTARQSNRTWIGIAVSSDGRIQTGVVDGGQIYTSYDYGVTWTARESNRTWWGIAMSSDGRIQTAVHYNGQIYTSYATTITPNPITVLGSISSTAAIYASGGNSTEWNRTTTTVRSISAKIYQTGAPTFSALAGNYYLVNTNITGQTTAMLPGSPTIGDNIGFADAAAIPRLGLSGWSLNPLVINRNGNMIEGLSENLVCDIGDISFTLTYIGGSIGWKIG